MRQVRDHCLAPARAGDAPLATGRYMRLFPELPALAIEPQMMPAIGRAGGLSDGTNGGPSDARTIAAGRPVFGQYLAHDLTADRSPLTHHDDAELLRERPQRTARSGGPVRRGPVGNPYLYSRHDPARLLLGRSGPGQEDDLSRNPEGVALAGDPRQDVHVLISQMHVAMIRAHNRLVDRLREAASPTRTCSTRPGGRSRGITSTWCCTTTCPRRSARSGRPGCWNGDRGASALRTPSPSRWSSPTRPTGSGTARCATATSSNRAVPPSSCCRT